MTDAEELNERGRASEAAGEAEAAIRFYSAAIDADRSWSVPWYNLGLLYKYRAQWRDSFDCNRKAVELSPEDEAAWWNLGIAATALGEWPTAREAWASCGINLPEGSGPVELNVGLTPIRLDPERRGEVVWSERICPARAVIRNVPLPESGHFYGDIVLHDGAPTGFRMLNGKKVPVFNALDRLVRSVYRTFILDLPGSTAAQRAELAEVAFERGTWAEDWSRSVTFLCRSCSEGLPHTKHDSELGDRRPELAVAAAAKDAADLEGILDAWRKRAGFTGYLGFVDAGHDII